MDPLDNMHAHSICSFVVCDMTVDRGAAIIVGCGDAQQAYMDGMEAAEPSRAKRSSGALLKHA